MVAFELWNYFSWDKSRARIHRISFSFLLRSLGIAMSRFSSPCDGSEGLLGIARVNGPTLKNCATSVILMDTSGFLSPCFSNIWIVLSSHSWKKPSFHFLERKPREKYVRFPVFNFDPIWKYNEKKIKIRYVDLLKNERLFYLNISQDFKLFLWV